MTQERKVLISPQDILAVGYECPHCCSTYFVPIDKIDRVITLCPNCQQRIIAEMQPSSDRLAEKAVFEQFLSYLKALRARDFGSHVRFEIRGESQFPMPLTSQKSGQAQ